jgi:hypothetical protein
MFTELGKRLVSTPENEDEQVVHDMTRAQEVNLMAATVAATAEMETASVKTVSMSQF